jgi:hypothetical protein
MGRRPAIGLVGDRRGCQNEVAVDLRQRRPSMGSRDKLRVTLAGRPGRAMKTANTLTVPPSILALADEVIE